MAVTKRTKKTDESSTIPEELNAENMDEVYKSLMTGIDAHMVSDTSRGVMHDRPKVPTPVPQLNCIFGGGIPLGIIAEFYGDPSCFTGDTKIMTLDGKSYTISQLFHSGVKNFGIYNCDSQGNITTDIAESVYQAKLVKELMEIETDFGKITCTTDHPFMLSSGVYKKAEELTDKDELMSIYRTKDIDKGLSVLINKDEKVKYQDIDKSAVNLFLKDSKTINYVHTDFELMSYVNSIKKIELEHEVPVYGIVNAGKQHNYAIALDDNHGVFVSNSGKSSTSYQMLGEFQKMYPPGKGLAIIVDTEASVDSSRMHFLGCDARHIMRIPAGTVEQGFKSLYTILDKKVANPVTKDLPVFILWDTIGVSPTEKEMESDSEHAQGMMGHGKLIKNQLSKMLPRIEQQPIILVLLNQVYTSMDMYGHAKLVSGGGYGLKHNAHLRVEFRSGKNEGEGGDEKSPLFVTAKTSTINLEKSKISPLFKGIPFVIDVTKGGAIDPIRSMLTFARDRLDFFSVSGGRYKIKPEIWELMPEYDNKFDKFSSTGASFHWKELEEYAQRRPKIVKFFQLCFLKQISEMYDYQAEICKPYVEKLREEMEESELEEQADGSTIDLWTKKKVGERTKSNLEALTEQLKKQIASNE